MPVEAVRLSSSRLVEYPVPEDTNVRRDSHDHLLRYFLVAQAPQARAAKRSRLGLLVDLGTGLGTAENIRWSNRAAPRRIVERKLS